MLSSMTTRSMAFSPDFLSCAELETTAGQLRWLVKKVLVADQPAVIGAAKKTLKTSIAVDLSDASTLDFPQGRAVRDDKWAQVAFEGRQIDRTIAR